MPLGAQLDGERILGPLLDDDAWAKLSSRARTDPKSVLAICCGWPVIPKRSRRGLRFFAHRPGGDCRLGEGADHLAVKALALQALHERGYEVDTEHAGPGWRADVYGRRDGRQVAVEVQWSRQTDHETERRTKLMQASGLEVLWLQRGGEDPLWPDAPLRLELARSHSPDGYQVALDGPASVREAIGAWLDGHLIRVPWAAVTRREIFTVHQHHCQACGAKPPDGPARLHIDIAENCACGVPDHGVDAWDKQARRRDAQQAAIAAFGCELPRGLHLDRLGNTPKLVGVCPSCGDVPRPRPRGPAAVVTVRDSEQPVQSTPNSVAGWHWTRDTSACGRQVGEPERPWRRGYELEAASKTVITPCRIRCHHCSQWYDGIHATATVNSRCGHDLKELSLRDRPLGAMLLAAARHGRVPVAPLRWLQAGVLVIGWKNVCPCCGAPCGQPWLEHWAQTRAARAAQCVVQVDPARWLIEPDSRVPGRGHFCRVQPPCDTQSPRWRRGS